MEYFYFKKGHMIAFNPETSGFPEAGAAILVVDNEGRFAKLTLEQPYDIDTVKMLYFGLEQIIARFSGYGEVCCKFIGTNALIIYTARMDNAHGHFVDYPDTLWSFLCGFGPSFVF